MKEKDGFPMENVGNDDVKTDAFIDLKTAVGSRKSAQPLDAPRKLKN